MDIAKLELHEDFSYNNLKSVITRLRNIMQEFLVKYAHKYAQKSTKICKNVLKYALNMQKNYFQ